MIEYLVLENPWPLGCTLVIAGLLIISRHRYTGRARPRLAALAAVISGVVVIAVGSLTTTTREHITEKTAQLIGATAPADMPVLQEMLDQQVVLVGPHGQVWMQADALLSELERALQRFTISNHRVRDLVVQVENENMARCYIDLRTSAAGWDDGMMIRSQWRLTWQRRSHDDNWRVTEIQWLQLQGAAPMQGIWR